ncbi:helix-turn-helix domain-containing protein [Streptomyces cinerochromogenes]|uniref:Helix-turn-helix domain-containing protein n=1 Tax=Streptomyces cinerochromogenes TaxID=66422 RepID=A0ABW7BGK0_9ACTN
MPRWKPLPEGTEPSVRQLVAHLRRLKDRSGLTLAALETKTGCSRSSWERYLAGRALPSQRAVEALCELSGTDPVRLLALREVAQTVWDASAAGGENGTAYDDRTAGEGEGQGGEREGEGGEGAGRAGEGRAQRHGVGRGVFALAVTAAFAVAALTGTLLGRAAGREATPATRLPLLHCHVRSEEGALYAGYGRTWKRTIGLGYYDEWVAEAECLLSHHGYDTGPVDGLYDIATRDAVRRAQVDGGVVHDGIVGRDTWPVLRREG